MDRELRRPGVTRALLWEEYRTQFPDGFGYAWFGEHFDAWEGHVRPTMRQTSSNQILILAQEVGCLQQPLPFEFQN
jgi:transposase